MQRDMLKMERIFMILNVKLTMELEYPIILVEVELWEI